MIFCVPCRRGLHNSCKAMLTGNTDYCECLHDTKKVNPPPPQQPTNVIEENVPDLFSVDVPDEVIRTRKQKSDHQLKDQQSTGRKRAAKLYPLDKEAVCEWANKRGVGGGVTIDGCGIRLDSSGSPTPVGKQQSRHHGPDYNTLNNDPGNVHRICHRCHNSWHAVNDPHKAERYQELYGVMPDEENLSSAAKELRSGVVND